MFIDWPMNVYFMFGRSLQGIELACFFLLRGRVGMVVGFIVFEDGNFSWSRCGCGGVLVIGLFG